MFEVNGEIIIDMKEKQQK